MKIIFKKIKTNNEYKLLTIVSINNKIYTHVEDIICEFNIEELNEIKRYIQYLKHKYSYLYLQDNFCLCVNKDDQLEFLQTHTVKNKKILNNEIKIKVSKDILKKIKEIYP